MRRELQQGGLFDALEGGSIQQRFERWLAKHGDVYDLFRRLAFQLKDAGREHYGAKSIAEVIRFHHATSTQGETFKLNNVFVSRLARKLVAEHPEFNGFFEMRRLLSP